MPITSSPKNIKALFDFSVAGPLAGLFASFVLLYNGLELTAFMDLAAREQLPAIPVEILRISALGGALVEYLLGDGILNSPNPTTDLIKLHPYAIAGFGGLITNALSLLPIGNTDGGRISVAFFGRSFARVVQGFFILILALAGSKSLNIFHLIIASLKRKTLTILFLPQYLVQIRQMYYCATLFSVSFGKKSLRFLVVMR